MRVVHEGKLKPHPRYLLQLWSEQGFWFGDNYYHTIWGARLSRWGLNNYEYRIIDTWV